MATDIHHHEHDQNTSTMISDIIRDAQTLFSQQLALFRAEVREDFHKTKEAVYPILLGGGVAAVGVILLSLMMVYLLHEQAGFLLWQAFGLVGAGFAAVGAVAVYAGVKRLESFNPLPDKSAEALKDNIEALTPHVK